MTDLDYDFKLEELERMLNDPDSKMEPARVWSLVAEISKQAAKLPAAKPATV